MFIMLRRTGLSTAKAAFNAGQSALANASAIWAYLLIGGRSFDSFAAASWPAILLFTAVQHLVNQLLVAAVIALNERKSFVQLARAHLMGGLATRVLITPIAFGLGLAYIRFGIPLATIMSLGLIGAHYFSAQSQELARVNQELLELMVKAMEARDPYTSGHSRRVSAMATRIAEAVGLPARACSRIQIAGLLHDVGKIHEKYAPILRKPDRLSKDEWLIMQEHPAEGAALVATISRLRDIVPAIRNHHEAWDGTGYPDGLKGEEIPLWARIITFADTIDAMTSDRPYRRALSEAEVRVEIERCAGTQFDPQIAATLLASPQWPMLFGPKDQAEARFGVHLVAEVEESALAHG